MVRFLRYLAKQRVFVVVRRQPREFIRRSVELLLVRVSQPKGEHAVRLANKSHIRLRLASVRRKGRL